MPRMTAFEFGDIRVRSAKRFLDGPFKSETMPAGAERGRRVEPVES